MLLGRRSECARLDELLAALRSGKSQALVLRGAAGVGKSALLAYLIEQAAGCRVARATGAQSEMELAFAALHQFCAPMLDHLERVPGPQRDALTTAFGMRAGPAPDRFFVGLAVLSLVAEVAEHQPLICVIDDAQWLDTASAQSLAFVARRLLAEPVAVVFAIREPSADLDGLPELEVGGLDEESARRLLGSVVRGRLDHRIRDRIVAETRGNPLALLQLPRGLTRAELAGGFGVPDATALSDRIEDSYRRRLEQLPHATRRLMLIAAAEATGDPLIVLRAAERLGIRDDAITAASAAELLDLGPRVHFHHPLVRSAIYQAASEPERREAHARETYLDALNAGMFAAHLTAGGLVAVARSVLAAPPAPDPPRSVDLLLDGLALYVAEGAAAATPILRRAVSVFRSDGINTAEELRWLWMACIAAVALWDDAALRALAERHVELARDAGALPALMLALSMRVVPHWLAGELAESASLADETRELAVATGAEVTLYGELQYAAWRGQEALATDLIDACARDATARSEGVGLLAAGWASAVLYNGLGRYEEACAAAEAAAGHYRVPGVASWSLSELVEAAARTGKVELALDAQRRLSELVAPVGSD